MTFFTIIIITWICLNISLLIRFGFIKKNYREFVKISIQTFILVCVLILERFKIGLNIVSFLIILGLFVPELIVKAIYSWAVKHNRKVDSRVLAPLKYANALSSILKTHKNAYKFSQDKESLIAFLVYIYLGGDEVKITDDMARLIEKQLRMKDLYLDSGLNADKTEMLPEDERAKLRNQFHEESKVFVWIPVIDVAESLSEGATCLDIKVSSITLAKSRFEDDIDFHNVIACPVNEYYTGNQFTKDQILIVEQDRYINEIISYSHDNDELIISGKLLFAVNKFESLPNQGAE